ncbi:MAG TPA: hypothetical protein VFU22_07260 [Roseiflexaceae bacterium]|nr:hypothetical protein [Roseiflexaceae bacterium]
MPTQHSINRLHLLAALALLAMPQAVAPRAAAAAICSASSAEIRRAPAAQATEAHHAGLVIDFGDGRVMTFCIDLGDDGQATGEELLRASNLPVIIEYNGGVGGAVCKIDTVGSNFPSEPCFSHCTLRPGEPCIYWSYSQLVGDRWQFSQIGASSTIVHSGDVNGWAWGESTIARGALPPLRTLAEICMPATATPTASATPTATATPSAMPTATQPLVAAPPAIETPYVAQINTPTLSATPTSTPTASPMPTTPVPATSTGAGQSSRPTAQPAATSPTPLPAPPTATPSATPSPPPTIAAQVAQAGASLPSPEMTSRGAVASLRIQLPLIQHAVVATPGATMHPTAQLEAATATPSRVAPPAIATPPRSQPVAPDNPTRTYPYFGGIAVLLLAGWALLRRDRRTP